MSTGTQTHRLDLGAAGTAAIKLTFAQHDIEAAVDLPSGLNRKNRRFVQRWSADIFRKLDPDPRGIRVVATTNGRPVALGFEYRGKGVVIFT